MTKELFWTLFEQAWSPSVTNPYRKLKEDLERLSLGELLSFSEIFDRYRTELLSPSHLAAAYLLYEGVLDEEDFLEYAESVVAVPRKVYLSVKNEPDRILDYDIYRGLLNFDGYPFASLAPLVGRSRFGTSWDFEMAKRDFEPIDIGNVVWQGRKGYDILTAQTCSELVPKFFERFASNCEWEVE